MAEQLLRGGQVPIGRGAATRLAQIIHAEPIGQRYRAATIEKYISPWFGKFPGNYCGGPGNSVRSDGLRLTDCHVRRRIQRRGATEALTPKCRVMCGRGGAAAKVVLRNYDGQRPPGDRSGSVGEPAYEANTPDPVRSCETGRMAGLSG